MGLEVGPALGQKRHGQHVLGGHPTQLVEADRHGLGVTHRVAVVSWTNFNIGVSLPAGLTRRNRCLVNLEGTRALQEIAIHNFWL